MMGWSVGVFIVESLSVRASGSVRDHEVPTSASIDSRERPERRALSESPRFLAPPFVFTPDWCARSPPALSPSPLGVSGLFAVCARSSAPFVWVHTLLELGAQHTYLDMDVQLPNSAVHWGTVLYSTILAIFHRASRFSGLRFPFRE